jgi:hypothetical protein
LLVEATQTLLDGPLDEGHAARRSCINATIGFEKSGGALGRSPRSLMRMFGPSGNPTAENLLGVSASCRGGGRSSASARRCLKMVSW